MTAIRDTLATDLARVRQPIETTATLPPAVYASEDVLAHERGAIFHGGWIGLGRADRWREPGDYSALDIAGAPVLVVRDKTGALRAYSNTCRHRGAQLLKGEGNCRGIKCPFHAWAYALDGRLVAAPRMENTAGFERRDYGLVAFRMEERDGFAFASLAKDPEPIDAWLGGFSALHAGWNLASLVSTRRREFEVACNWKSFLEVFNEYYHLPFVHGSSFGDTYGEPDAPEEVTGNFISQFGETKRTGGLLKDQQEHALPVMESLQGRNRSGARYTWAYPNMTFAANTEAIWVYDVLPIATGRTRVGLTACFPPETVALPGFEERAEHYYERLDVAIEEDIEMLEQQYPGLASPYATQGRFADLEPNVAHFACWYAERMRAA